MFRPKYTVPTHSLRERSSARNTWPGTMPSSRSSAIAALAAVTSIWSATATPSPQTPAAQVPYGAYPHLEWLNLIVKSPSNPALHNLGIEACDPAPRLTYTPNNLLVNYDAAVAYAETSYLCANSSKNAWPFVFDGQFGPVGRPDGSEKGWPKGYLEEREDVPPSAALSAAMGEALRSPGSVFVGQIYDLISGKLRLGDGIVGMGFSTLR